MCPGGTDAVVQASQPRVCSEARDGSRPLTLKVAELRVCQRERGPMGEV